MNCQEFDLKAFLLNEATPQERRGVEQHLALCTACAAEYHRLGLTTAALLAVPAEEPPRRIAFVSDKVFEPNWWQRFWHSAPRLGFASAALLAAAILVHAFRQPGPAPLAAIDPAAIEAKVASDLDRRVSDAVRLAVAGIEQNHQAAALRMVQAAEERLRIEHRAEVATFERNIEYLEKKINIYRTASNFGGPQP